MAESKYSPEAFALVNEVHDRIRPMTGPMVWKPVALALAEALLAIMERYTSLRISEYGDDGVPERDLKEAIDLEVWKWLEVKHG